MQYLKKEVTDEVGVFCMLINSKVSFKLILTHLGKFPTTQYYKLFIGMIKHSQRTHGNKFAISLQYLKKEVSEGVHFLHGDKQNKFYKLALLLLMEVARHVQSIQNRKLVIFLQYNKEKVLQLLLCSIVMQNIQIF